MQPQKSTDISYLLSKIFPLQKIHFFCNLVSGHKVLLSYWIYLEICRKLEEEIGSWDCPFIFFLSLVFFKLIFFMSVIYLYVVWYVEEDLHWTFVICTLFSLYRLLENSALLGDFEHATVKCETIVLGNTS